MQFDLGYFDEVSYRGEPLENPFQEKMLPMSSVQSVTYVPRMDRLEMAEGMGFEPTIRYNPYNGLANRRLQPLGHPSKRKHTLINYL